MSDLTETEVATLLTPCDCGHTINDHGELAGCWACNDSIGPYCDVSFETLLVARVASIVEHRTEPQPTADDQTEAECQPNREASR